MALFKWANGNPVCIRHICFSLDRARVVWNWVKFTGKPNRRVCEWERERYRTVSAQASFFYLSPSPLPLSLPLSLSRFEKNTSFSIEEYHNKTTALPVSIHQTVHVTSCARANILNSLHSIQKTNNNIATKKRHIVVSVPCVVFLTCSSYQSYKIQWSYPMQESAHLILQAELDYPCSRNHINETSNLKRLKLGSSSNPQHLKKCKISNGMKFKNIFGMSSSSSSNNKAANHPPPTNNMRKGKKILHFYHHKIRPKYKYVKIMNKLTICLEYIYNKANMIKGLSK